MARDCSRFVKRWSPKASICWYVSRTGRSAAAAVGALLPPVPWTFDGGGCAGVGVEAGSGSWAEVGRRGVCPFDPTPRNYNSPGAATSPSHAIAALRLGSQAQTPHKLGLLMFGSLLIVALYVIAEFGAKSKIPANIGPFLGIVLALALAAHMANRWLVPDANTVILPLAALLNGIGYVIIARWNPPYARQQAGWVALGIVLYVATLLVVRYTRDLERYRYLLLLLAGVLLVAPLFFSPINGARLWVHVGGLRFQPIEFSKLLLCIYFASYFAANKELLSIPTAGWATASSSTRARCSPCSWPGARPWR